MKPALAALVIQNCISGNLDKNLESTTQGIKDAAGNGADFIVFPEMNLTGYASGANIQSIARPLTAALTHHFHQLAMDHQVTILVGMAQKNDDQIYASHLVFSPDGLAGTYCKTHISPYEKAYFTAGQDIPTFESCQVKFGIQLCYDAHFPELTLAMALSDVDIIFIPHASPRGTSEEKFESWIRHLRARAFDNGLFVAAFNQVGHNGRDLNFPGVAVFIGPDGNIISRSLTDQPTIHYCRIDPQKLDQVRSHKMRYFLPNRRNDIFPF